MEVFQDYRKVKIKRNDMVVFKIGDNEKSLQIK